MGQVMVRFEKSETCAEQHPGEPSERVLGPFDFIQLTYSLLRAGPGHPTIGEAQYLASMTPNDSYWELFLAACALGEGSEFYSDVMVFTRCDDCANEPIPGIHFSNTGSGTVERCDTCALFDGDLTAALALAKLVGGEVQFEATEDRLIHVYTGPADAEGLTIVEGTDPWIVVDGLELVGAMPKKSQ
jgi:hypothetical protein